MGIRRLTLQSHLSAACRSVCRAGLCTGRAAIFLAMFIGSVCTFTVSQTNMSGTVAFVIYVRPVTPMRLLVRPPAGVLM